MDLHRIDDVGRRRFLDQEGHGLRRFEVEAVLGACGAGQEGIIPPVRNGVAGALQGALGHEPIRLLIVDRSRGGHEVPGIAAGPGSEREAVVDIEVVPQSLAGPHAVHRLAGRADSRNGFTCHARVALRIGPRQQRVRELTRVRLNASGVRFHGPYPFRYQHGFDPHVVARQCLLDLERHAQFAEAPEEWHVDGERRRGAGAA